MRKITICVVLKPARILGLQPLVCFRLILSRQKDLSTIELISEAQFLSEAPPDLKDVAETDPHELMIKRLQYENLQRIS